MAEGAGLLKEEQGGLVEREELVVRSLLWELVSLEELEGQVELLLAVVEQSFVVLEELVEVLLWEVMQELWERQEQVVIQPSED